MPCDVEQHDIESEKLTLEQEAAYFRIMRKIWRYGAVSSDPTSLAAACRITKTHWLRHIQSAVMPLFEVAGDGLITHARVRESKEYAQKIGENRSRNAHKRWQNDPLHFNEINGVAGAFAHATRQQEHRYVHIKEEKEGKEESYTETPRVEPLDVNNENATHRTPEYVPRAGAQGDAMLSIDDAKVQVIPAVAAVPPEDAAPLPSRWARSKLPRLDEPDDPRWIGSGLARGHDGQPVVHLDKHGRKMLMAGVPGVNRVALRPVCQAAVDAAAMRGSHARDWETVVGWLGRGWHWEKDIVAGITARSERAGYIPPSSLKYFTNIIHEFRDKRIRDEQKGQAA